MKHKVKEFFELAMRRNNLLSSNIWSEESEEKKINLCDSNFT